MIKSKHHISHRHIPYFCIPSITSLPFPLNPSLDGKNHQRLSIADTAGDKITVNQPKKLQSAESPASKLNTLVHAYVIA